MILKYVTFGSLPPWGYMYAKEQAIQYDLINYQFGALEYLREYLFVDLTTSKSTKRSYFTFTNSVTHTSEFGKRLRAGYRSKGSEPSY